MNSYAIGEAAKMVGVSAKAIRLWEAKGLIPQADRTESRYRLFTDSDLSSMRFIRQAKLLGLTLGEIKRILNLGLSGVSPCNDVRELIDNRVSDIDQHIADLQHLRRTLIAARSAAPEQRFGSNGSYVCGIIETIEMPG